MKLAVQIKDLSFIYPNGNLALENISLDISEGESVAIIGPNGAGKSTLLLHLNGILKGEKGNVEIFGDDTLDGDIREIRRRVGIVFQDPDDQLFMPTVFDDVAFGPINLGLAEKEVNERVFKALSMVGLDGYGDKCPHNLSFGEKKRLCLATILSMDPDILVLDEPASNLDPRSRQELIGTIKKLKQEGKTIITATHDVNAVAEIADRIYVLNKRILAEGATRDIFSRTELLRGEGLSVPEVARLFDVLRCFGYDCADLPLSIDEAITHLTETIESAEGEHIHLHIHEHTHSELDETIRKHNHVHGRLH